MDCRICGAKDVEPSMGGSDVCPSCDCGHWPDGRQWTFEETMAMIGREPERSAYRRKVARKRTALGEFVPPTWKFEIDV